MSKLDRFMVQIDRDVFRRKAGGHDDDTVRVGKELLGAISNGAADLWLLAEYGINFSPLPDERPQPRPLDLTPRESVEWAADAMHHGR